MKKYFVNLSSKKEFDYNKILKELETIKEKKIAICYSNQFEHYAKELKELIKSFEITEFHQVLGCSNINFLEETEAILFIGEGKFHAVSIAYESKLPIYVLDSNSLTRIKDEEVKKLEQKEKSSYLNYLNSEKVGILVSSKPGQQRLKRALEFKRNNKNKKYYLFISNNVDINEFENFQIDSWINTACPRIDLNENNIININKIKF